MKKVIFILCVLIFNASRTQAQDQAFINTNQSLVNLNPSFAGSNGFVRNQFSYSARPATKYWSRQTVMLNSVDGYIKPINGGIAFSTQYTNSGDGTYKTRRYSLAYAQYFSLMDGQVKIVPSVQLGYAENRLDLDKAGFHNPNTIYFGELPSARRNYFDLSSGILVNYKNKLYAGFSVLHINQPYGSLYGGGIPFRFNYHLSYNVKASELLRLQFSGNLQLQQIDPLLLLAANAVYLRHIVLGLGNANLTTAFLNAGYRNNYFTLMLNYSRYLPNDADSDPFKNAWQLQASFNLRNKEHRRALTSFESW